MSDIAWIMSILFAALLFWGLAGAVAQRFLTVDEILLSVLKLMLRQHDVDLRKIPNAALIEIVSRKVDEAKTLAGLSETKASAPDSWQRYLFPLLETEARLIANVMRQGAEKYADSRAAQVLLKFGVVEPHYPPAMSVEQFAEAAKRGSLFAELEERLSKREFS